MIILHLTTSIILILAHGSFLFRGLYFLHKKTSPTLPDKIARNLAQLFIPLTILSGLLVKSSRQPSFLLHILPPLLIIFFIPLAFILRKFVLKTKKWPWLLPGINLALMLCAFLSGIGG